MTFRDEVRTILKQEFRTNDIVGEHVTDEDVEDVVDMICDAAASLVKRTLEAIQ